MPGLEPGLSAQSSFHAFIQIPSQVGSWLYPLLSLCSLLLSPMRRKPAVMYALICYPWILILAYARIGAPPEHTWEIYSATFFFHFAVLVGIWSLVWALRQPMLSHQFPWRLARTSLIGAVLLLVIMVVWQNGHACFKTLRKQQNTYWLGGRHQEYLEVSRWINDHAPRGVTVASLEVGTIGYFSDVRMIDLYGLVTKGSKPGDPGWTLRQFRPDFVLFRGNIQAPITSGENLHYQPVQFFPGPHYRPVTLARRLEPA